MSPYDGRPMDAHEAADRLKPSGRSAIILDVDGTLAPIAPRPERAAVPPEARQELDRLVGSYGLVGVVSGRPTAEVTRLVGVEGIRYEGLYGLEGSPPISQDVTRRIEAAVAPIEGAWVEHKVVSLTAHVREASDPEDAERRLTAALTEIARQDGLEVVRGKRTIELAPPGSRKGGAVERLVRESDARAVLFAGDDLPDLEAFDALDELASRGMPTVKVAVRGEETPDVLVAAADLIVEGPSGLVALLRLL